MAQTFMAQMSKRQGVWRLYVVLLDTTDLWPEFSFERAEPVPTFTERVNALSMLGFEPAAGDEWDWSEYSTDPDDPASPVTMLAALRVRSRTEADA